MRSVVVLAIDRLGAPHLGPYGNTWIETPAFNRLASESLLFENVLIDSVNLEGTYQSFWLGSHALEREASPAHGKSCVEILNAEGIATRLVTDCPQLLDHPLADAFLRCDRLHQPDAEFTAASYEDTGLASFFAHSVEALGQIEEPTLLWLHATGMDGPWDAPLDFRRQFVDEGDPLPPDFVAAPHQIVPHDCDPDWLYGVACAYAGQLTLLDMCLDALLDAAGQHSQAAEMLIVLVSPRGFPLGEHGCVGQPEARLYRELLHVPVLLRHPQGQGATHRLPCIIQPHHLASTLTNWFDLGERTFWEAIPGAAATDCRLGVCRSADQWAVRTPAWFARFPSVHRESSEASCAELYLKPDDGWEVNDVADRCAEITSELGKLVSDLRTGDAQLNAVRLSESMCRQ